MTDNILEAVARRIEEAFRRGVNPEKFPDIIRTMTAPAPRVKPLVWRYSYGVIRADGPFGTYRLTGINNKIIVLPNGANMVVDGDPQAAAQAHHDAQVLAMLEP